MGKYNHDGIVPTPQDNNVVCHRQWLTMLARPLFIIVTHPQMDEFVKTGQITELSSWKHGP